MKKVLLLLLVSFVFIWQANGQTPPFHCIQSPAQAISTNAFPLNSTTSNRVQWIYRPNYFGSGGVTNLPVAPIGTPAFIGLIDTLWVRVNTATASTTYTNLQVSIGQNVGTDTALVGTAWQTGLTICQGPTTFVTGAVTAGGWIKIPLATPFLYNPALSMVVEVQQQGYTPTGLSSYQSTNRPGARRWGLWSAAVGSTPGTGLIDLGMSLLSPLPCPTPTNLNATALTQTSATLGWTQTGTVAVWDIEYGPVGFTPTGTPNIVGTTTNPHVLTGLTQNTTYSYYVRAYCGVGDSSYFNGPFTFTTLASCPWPTALTATNLTSSSADLDWTENGSATNWGIELGVAGFAQTGNANFYTSTKPFTVGPLIGNTSFAYYVRSICGVGDSSQWTGPFTFITPLAPLPCVSGNPSTLFQNSFVFNSATQTPVTAVNLPGWTRSGVGPVWNLDINTPSSGANSGAASSAPSPNGLGHVFLETSSGTIGQADTLISPLIDLTAATGNARVTFYYHMFGATTGSLNLFIDNGTTISSVWSLTGQQQTSPTAPWILVDVNLAAYVGNTIRLKFAGIRGSSFTGDLALDEVKVEACVACAGPSNLIASNITTTSADLNWTESGSATQWDIEVVTSGSPQTGVPTYNNVTVTANDPSINPYTITGLTLYQAVDVYVRADCSPDTSIWIGPVTILPCAPLAGTYTIDPALAASATNFQSFSDAAFALQCGISAPVIFNVNPATPYVESFNIPIVTGSSPTNTITWNGNGAQITFLSTATTATDDRHTMRISGTDHMIFNDLKFENTHPTYAHAVHIWNDANDIKFTNCEFKVSTTATGSDVNAFVVCNVNADATTLTAPIGCDSIKADSCDFIGGYWGAYLIGGSPTYGTGYAITNSKFEDCHLHANYNFYHGNYLFSKNEITRPTRTAGAGYAVYASTGVTNSLFEKNHIHDIFSTAGGTGTVYGFEFYADGTSAADANIIENNLIENIGGNGTQYGIYSSTANWLTVRHNTVVLDNAASTGGITRGIYMAGTAAAGQVCQNNNVVVTRGGTGIKYGVWLDATAANLTESNNNTYVNAPAGTNYYGRINATNCADLTAWTTAGGAATDINVDPLFVNPAIADYTPANPAMNDLGAPLGVLEDFLSAPRSATTPDMGAFEFIVVPNDVSATAIISPDTTVGCYTATQTVNVQITNYGSSILDLTVNPVTITASVTGTVTQTLTALVNTGTIAPLGTLTVALAPTVNMTANGTYTIDAWTTMVGDGNATNDTLFAPYVYNVGVVAGTLTASPNSLCISGTPTLSLSGQKGGTIQWQESTVSNMGPWTNVGTGGTSFAPAAPVTQTTYYRAYSICNTNSDTTNVDTVIVNNPQIASVMHDTIDCGPNSASLSATIVPSSGTTVNWYDVMTGGAPLDTGAMFNTPVLSVTDTFYVAASAGAGAPTSLLTSPTGTNSCAGGTMFDITPTVDLSLDSIYGRTTGLTSGQTVNIYYKIGGHQGFETNPAAWTLFATVTSTTAPGVNILNIPFGSPLLLNASTTYGIYLNYSSGYNTGVLPGANYSNADMNVFCGTGLCGQFSGANFPRYHEGEIFYRTGCEGPRQPVYAVVNGIASGTLAQAAASNTSSTPGTATETTMHADGASLNYYDASCNLICNVTDAAGGNTLGNVTSAVTIDPSVQSYNGQPYVRRWYDITPSSQGPANITLNFTDDDFISYNANNGAFPDLATNAGAATTATVCITQISGGPLGTGTPTVHGPLTATWNATTNNWEVTFPVTGFSEFYCHACNPSNAALPVEISSFTVTKNGSVSEAKWTTETEINNSHFNVQRSTDGINFSTLGKVKSWSPDGNSNMRLNYNFTDVDPQVGHNYYRLQQVDLDGKIAYTNVIDILWGTNGSVVTIYPNPAKDILNVDISTDKASQIEVRILDMSGRTVKSVLAKTESGVNNLTIGLEEISSGIYSVQVFQNNKLTHVDKVRKND